MSATHWIAPALQCVVPPLHTPKNPVEQATPPPGSPSSVTLLQSLSLPSQTSGEGAPGSASHIVTPGPAHTLAPLRRHSPMPAEQGAPKPTHWGTTTMMEQVLVSFSA